MSEATEKARPMLREYETIYVLKPDIDRDGAAKVATRVEEVVVREGGKLTRVETWGRRLLAYPVQKHRRGVYVYLKYVGLGGIVSELERNLKLQDAIIKFQTVKLQDFVDATSVQVDPAEVKFEAIEPPGEEEPEESLERELGLADIDEPHMRRPGPDDVPDDDDEMGGSREEEPE